MAVKGLRRKITVMGHDGELAGFSSREQSGDGE